MEPGTALELRFLHVFESPFVVSKAVDAWIHHPPLGRPLFEELFASSEAAQNDQPELLELLISKARPKMRPTVSMHVHNPIISLSGI